MEILCDGQSAVIYWVEHRHLCYRLKNGLNDLVRPHSRLKCKYVWTSWRLRNVFSALWSGCVRVMEWCWWNIGRRKLFVKHFDGFVVNCWQKGIIAERKNMKNVLPTHQACQKRSANNELHTCLCTEMEMKREETRECGSISHRSSPFRHRRLPMRNPN